MASIAPHLVRIYLLISILASMGCTDQDTNNIQQVEDTLTIAQDLIPLMLRGINLGNTLEPDDEGGWNNGPALEYYFDDYKSAGFTCVRIPVKWGAHTLDYPPYTVDPDWMNRVDQVVSWGLARNLYIILNAHHESWIKEDYSESNIHRFETIWSQIAESFSHKSDKLLFEMINEPHGLTAEQVDDLNARVLPIIRVNNPTRIVIYSGHEWSAIDQMMSASILDDDYLMAYWHSYDPWSFAGEGQGTWGTTADINDIVSMFKEAGDWSAANNIPVMISEFGAVQACDYNSRMRHYATYVEEALRNNIPFQVWDDGGWFRIYEREDRTWPEVKDILIYAHPEGPTNLEINVGSNKLKISWRNRTTENDRIFIQRKVGDASFEEIAELGGIADEFEDNGLSAGVLYTYRILARIDSNKFYHSYPIRGGVQ
ncbi:MAG: cellulase family glycosylhydrolase [FCB group bacterium]|nr:cellulase family glycosylhydrolase [FCB group bacterium]MBL7027914.1 cellulase family glycosylhydrolase [Candidatus Neomarinimicrobiota bacterium]MBL7121923.1 cellulase family glycosylhydrolase [Candidatus Neomarinimicrobiota bacterium]